MTRITRQNETTFTVYTLLSSWPTASYIAVAAGCCIQLYSLYAAAPLLLLHASYTIAALYRCAILYSASLTTHIQMYNMYVSGGCSS
jgi:hypothetical protein